MKVKELIEKLKEYPNQDIEVFVYDVEESELHNLNDVDLDISDRVDLNIKVINTHDDKMQDDKGQFIN